MNFPILSKKFFDVHKPSVEFHSQWLGLSEWTERIIPVYQWEDILFIAFSSPPNTATVERINQSLANKNMKIVLALCDEVVLRQAWDQLQSLTTSNQKPASDSPEGLLDIAIAAKPSIEQLSPEDLIAENEVLDMVDTDSSKPNKALFDITRTSAQDDRNWDLTLQDAMTKLHGTYQKAMILLKDEDGLRPWKWDDYFQCSTSTPSLINLNKASLFRIVDKTQKPYHGYVVDSEINHIFFKEWNEGKIPEHITLAPMMIGETIVGMLLAVGQKNSNDKKNLLLCENLAINLAKKIESDPPQAKAA
jgi:hypothetical protein